MNYQPTDSNSDTELGSDTTINNTVEEKPIINNGTPIINRNKTQNHIDENSFRLLTISKKLRISGKLIFIFTLLNIVISLSNLVFIKLPEILFYYNNEVGNISVAFLFLSLSISVFCVYLLVEYDLLKRKGQILFEEISDSSQWKLSRTKSKKTYMNIKLGLREFAITTDLPLTRDSSGITVYFLLNTIALTSTVIVLFVT